jgi:hypothetical protein
LTSPYFSAYLIFSFAPNWKKGATVKTLIATLTIGFAALALCGRVAAGTDKTLVSWVTLTNTDQRGGSALTIQHNDQFDAIVMAVFGLRHLGAGGGHSLQGSITDARIYDRALSVKEIKQLEPREKSAVKPYAWWTFEKGQETNRMGRFPVNALSGGATIEGGRLLLPNEFAALIAGSAKRLRNIKTGEAVILRVFIDKNLVEVFANDRQAAVSACNYAPKNLGINLFSEGGDVRIRAVTGWKIKSIYAAP